MQRFPGGLVFQAHRLCASLNSRLDSIKEEEEPHCQTAGERGGNKLNGPSDFHTENGSRPSQNLVMTGFFVPSSFCSGQANQLQTRELIAIPNCSSWALKPGASGSCKRGSEPPPDRPGYPTPPEPLRVDAAGGGVCGAAVSHGKIVIRETS